MGTVRSMALVIAAVFASSVSANPRIEFDTKTFKCGEVLEGPADKLHAVFNISNTGTSLLTLKSVRPGCGCTVVKYDTTIKPGKTAKLQADVNIKGSRPGEISKSISVISDAPNDSMVRLTIEATVVAVIEVNDAQLTLGGDDTAHEKPVAMASKKKDLNVSEVFFRSNEGDNPGTLEWRKKLPLPFKYRWSASSDSARPNGYYPFTLSITVPKFTASEDGNLIVKTNHPDKPEVAIRTIIVPTKNAPNRK